MQHYLNQDGVPVPIPMHDLERVLCDAGVLYKSAPAYEYESLAVTDAQPTRTPTPLMATQQYDGDRAMLPDGADPGAFVVADGAVRGRPYPRGMSMSPDYGPGTPTPVTRRQLEDSIGRWRTRYLEANQRIRSLESKLQKLEDGLADKLLEYKREIRAELINAIDKVQAKN